MSPFARRAVVKRMSSQSYVRTPSQQSIRAARMKARGSVRSLRSLSPPQHQRLMPRNSPLKRNGTGLGVRCAVLSIAAVWLCGCGCGNNGQLACGGESN